jgi:outer membrane receptor protein involved in Fe transport
VSSGFRDPTVSDRYYRGPTGRGFVTGNPDLEPERSLQVDTGVRFTSSRLRAGLFYYHYRIDDLIERYQTAPDFFFFRNRDRANIRGVEGEAQLQMGTTTFDIVAAMTRGRAIDDDTPLDDMPPATLVLGLRQPLGARAFASVRAAFHAEDEEAGPTEVRMPGYTVIDFVASADLTRHVGVNLNVRNLLDRTYPASPDPRAVPAAGLNAVLTATVRF